MDALKIDMNSRTCKWFRLQMALITIEHVLEFYPQRTDLIALYTKEARALADTLESTDNTD